MPRRDQPSAIASPRGGFTLVELLAVIMIIALLAALLTPAVMNARRSARAAAVKAEIDLLHMALMNYKNEYGSFPPENMRGLWDDGNNRVNTGHPAYRHLKRIFPRINELESHNSPNDMSPYFFMAQMSPAQALVFWLQGYFENPQYPLTNRGANPLNPAINQIFATQPRIGSQGGARKKLFDFDEARLYAASPYWTAVALPPAPSLQTFVANRNDAPPFAANFPVYFPGGQNTSLPYVYFSNAGFAASPTAGPTFNEMSYQATAVNGGNTRAWPYLRSNAMNNDSWAACHWNADSFQLIAAGIDMTYGQADRPIGFPEPFPFTSWNSVALGAMPGVTEAAATGHADNITNFASGTLKEAAEKLLAQ